MSFPADWKATLNSLNVDARQPRGEKIVVDKSDSVLRVLDGQGKLVAQFRRRWGRSMIRCPSVRGNLWRGL